MIARAPRTTNDQRGRMRARHTRSYAADLALRFDAQLCLVGSDKPSRFVFDLTGQIVLLKDAAEINVGHFSTLFVDVCSAMDEDEEIAPIFESYGAPLAQVYAAIFDTNLADIRREVNWPQAEVDPIYNPNLLLIHELTVIPEHTGHSVELLALRGLIHRMHAGVGLTAIAKSDERRTTEYAWLGFKPFYDTEFLVRGTTLLLPTAKALMALR